MSGPNDDLVPTAPLRAIQIVVAALILGVVAFGIVAIVQPANNRPGPVGQPFLVYAVAVFAALAVPASFVVPRLVAAGQRRQAAPDVNWVPLYQIQLLVGLAVLEGASFFALVSYFIEGNVIDIAIAAVMIALMGLRFPTQARVERWIWRQQELVEQRQASI